MQWPARHPRAHAFAALITTQSPLRCSTRIIKLRADQASRWSRRCPAGRTLTATPSFCRSRADQPEIERGSRWFCREMRMETLDSESRCSENAPQTSVKTRSTYKNSEWLRGPCRLRQPDLDDSIAKPGAARELERRVERPVRDERGAAHIDRHPRSGRFEQYFPTVVRLVAASRRLSRPRSVKTERYEVIVVGELRNPWLVTNQLSDAFRDLGLRPTRRSRKSAVLGDETVNGEARDFPHRRLNGQRRGSGGEEHCRRERSREPGAQAFRAMLKQQPAARRPPQQRKRKSPVRVPRREGAARRRARTRASTMSGSISPPGRASPDVFAE